MPKFVKTEAELVTRFDKWLYRLKNLNKFSEIPYILQERIFRKVFDIAEKGIKKGIKEGIEVGKKSRELEIALRMKKENMAIEIISKITACRWRK